MNIKQVVLPLALTVGAAMVLNCGSRYTINAENIIVNLNDPTSRLIDQKNVFMGNAFNSGTAKNATDPSAGQVTPPLPPSEDAAAAPPLGTLPPPSSDLAFLKRYFDDGQINILKNMKRADGYLLDPEKETGSGTSFNKIAVIAPPVKLNEEQLAYLQRILLNEDNYQKDSLVKKCAFIPDVGIRIYADDTTAFVDLMTLLYCDDWRFVSGEKMYQGDNKPARNALLRLVRNLFKDDRHL